jgi:hypothetical protein
MLRVPIDVLKEGRGVSELFTKLSFHLMCKLITWCEMCHLSSHCVVTSFPTGRNSSGERALHSRPGIHPGPVRVGFVVDMLARRWTYRGVLWFFPLPSHHSTGAQYIGRPCLICDCNQVVIHRCRVKGF